MVSRLSARLPQKTLLRRLVGSGLLGLLLMLPGPTAWADSWRHWGYDRHYDDRYDGWRSDYGWRSGYGRHDYRSRSYHSRYWPRSHRYRDSYFSFSLGHSRNRHYYNRHYDWRSHDHDLAGFVGGVVLGSLISNAVQDRSTRRYEATPVRRVVRSSRPATSRSTSISGSRSRLLRDLQGRCFEIDYDPAGNQRRVQVDDSRCHF